MKKQVLILIVCLVFAAGLGGALYFLMSYEPEEESSQSSAPDTTVKLLDKTVYDLDTLSVQNDADSFVIKNLGDSKYTIEGLEQIPLNNSMLSSTANSGIQLSAKSIVAQDAQNLADFGLADPSITYTAKYTDGSSFSLELGNEAPGGNGIYGRTPDSQTVYLFSQYTFTNLSDSKLSFVEKSIVTPPTSAAADTDQAQQPIIPSQVTFGGSVRPEPIVIRDATQEQNETLKSYNITSYLMTAPKQRAVDSGKPTDAITSLMNITADSVAACNPTPEQMKQFGLDAPYSTVEFEYADYQQAKHKVSLKLSAPDAEGKAYLQKDGEAVIYQISVSSLPWYGLAYGDFLSRLLVLPYINDLKAITVTTPDKSFAFSLEGEDDTLKIRCNGSDVDTDLFRDYYQTLIGVPAEEFTQDKPVAGMPGMVTIVYEYRSAQRQPDKVELIPGPTRKVFLSVNGEAEFYTKESYARTIIANSDALLQGKEIQPLY